jgi:hypothetical protein
MKQPHDKRGIVSRRARVKLQSLRNKTFAAFLIFALAFFFVAIGLGFVVVLIFRLVL